VEKRRQQLRQLEKFDIGAINREMNRLALKQRVTERQATAGAPADPAATEAVRRRQAELQRQFDQLHAQVKALRQEQQAVQFVHRLADGTEAAIPGGDIIHYYYPNRLSWVARVGLFCRNLWVFVAAEPREANTEGGIFPALFGTVMMVFLMSLAVVPLGVLAALYLREYAKQGPLVRIVRIAVNNLAGVPSIVFGVFGLGFFVYFVGGGIDRIFFPEALPTPTYGTGGILWASLTLALLTVPVVIVATEEGLAAIPRGIREASLALSATKLETTLRVVLPAVMPSILTGLILAMARAAGEVAPLMITGVVKLAPALPLDGAWPFLHLDRKFMHLGFHIYDVGFQSPNVDAARPMVFATTLLLLFIVVLLNLFAIATRNRLRRKYAAAAV
jgi:phosphate transport system permease protein